MKHGSQEIDASVDYIASALEVFERLDELPTPSVPLKYSDRDAGRAPEPTEDPCNAVIRFCEVRGAESGPLAGRRIGVKDNIAVAGVPMTAGELWTQVPTPTEDAVVIERILDAGATIVAKTNLGLGTGAAAFGETRNPHNPSRTAGGSSSGSGAAVAAGIVDAALGTDLGGSVRRPAALCGIVGMKATHGLVPSYGLGVHTNSNVGPMTATVAENALLLEIIAGADWRDPQWALDRPEPGAYTDAASMGIAGLRIGVVAESLGPAGCTAGTMAAFERAQGTLASLGAVLVPVSAPLWIHASTILFAALTFEQASMALSFGNGYRAPGRVDPAVLETITSQQADSVDRQATRLTVEYLQTVHNGAHFGKAQNLRLELRRQIDSLLRDVDLLITPTTPEGPAELSADPAPGAEATQRAVSFDNHVFREGVNTRPLNLTEHPALTVPSGPGDDGLPTGLQIIGRRFDERTVYRAGFAFEQGSASH